MAMFAEMKISCVRLSYSTQRGSSWREARARDSRSSGKKVAMPKAKGRKPMLPGATMPPTMPRTGSTRLSFPFISRACAA